LEGYCSGGLGLFERKKRSLKTAFITGVTGQDGSYLTKNLLEKGYRVIGGHRRSSTTDLTGLNFLGVSKHPNLELVEHDVADLPSSIRALQKYRPSEVYNLAAQSFIGASFDQPNTTAQVTGIGPVNLLEAIRMTDLSIKFFQAGSSEMFGEVENDLQSEETSFIPRSPYGASKLFAHWMTVNYRDSHGIFGSSGILFNHESPLRGKEFVTRKITDAVARIHLGSKEVVTLGNLDALRDWGFAEEFVEGMWRMLQTETPDTFVLATGKRTSVRDFLRLAFGSVGIELDFEGQATNEIARNRKNGEIVVRVDGEFYRPNEPHTLCGDPSKAKELLGWQPSFSVEELATLMVEADINANKN
jgi:GDPmannose 4,6-dehydratase